MRPYTHGVVMTRGVDSTCDTNEDLFSKVGMELWSWLVFSYCWFMIFGPCQCVIPWSL